MTHADSKWNHSLCDPCWKEHTARLGEPGRVAVRVIPDDGAFDECCACAVGHRSGIFVRGKAADFARCVMRDDEARN